MSNCYMSPAKVDQNLAMFGQVRSTVGQVWPMLTKLGQKLVGFGGRRVKLSPQMLPGVFVRVLFEGFAAAFAALQTKIVRRFVV